MDRLVRSLELSELGNYIQFLDAVNKRMGE